MPDNEKSGRPELITIVGNVGKDPELRYTSSGKAVCNLSVAINTYPRQLDFKGEPETEWITVTCWEEIAESVAASLGRGMRIVVQGAPGADKWKDREGNFHVRKTLTARAIGPDLRWQTARVAKVKPRAHDTEPEEAPF